MRIKILSVKFPLQGIAPKGYLIDKIKPVFSFAVGILLVVFMLSALTSVARASTTDKFGVKELYPTASGGRQWVSTWDNGISRTWNAVGRDPKDPETLGKGSGTFKVDGQGIMKVSGDPRVSIVDANYPTSYTSPVPSTIKSWRNVEATVYGYRVNDTSETYGGLITYARTNHIFQDQQPCDSRGYGVRYRYDGIIDFAKENKHPDGTSTAAVTHWSSGLPYNKWIGQKFVVYDLPDGNVKLETYIDETNGANGGNWVKVDEFIDNGNDFAVGMTSCATGIDPALRLTNSDARSGTESGKPNAAVYLKIRGVGTDGLWLKEMSVREIDPYASSDPNTGSTDTTPPTVSSTDPANSATNVSITKTITATFSESVLSSTNYNSITLKDSYGNAVATTSSLSGSTLTINPTSNLTYSTTYTVTIPASAVKDSANNNLASQYTFSFTTSATQLALSTIAVSPSSASETKGNTQQFTAQPKDQFGNPYPATVTWTSSNTTVGTVTSTGLFTAITPGVTTITAKNGTITGTASETVINQSSGPVAYWKFDENAGTTASDSSGNGNTGTINGATWTTGEINSALLFNGLSNYLNVPDSNSLDITSGITIMAWIKSGSTWGPSAYPRIADKMGTAESSGYAFMIDKANNRLELSLPAADIYSNANVIASNQWYHVAATADGSSVKFYVNGNDAGTTASKALPTSNTLNLLIGDRSGSAGTRSFKGKIDEVKIYNRALTASEILADYNAG